MSSDPAPTQHPAASDGARPAPSGPRLTVVGGGKMGTAIAAGLLAAGWSPSMLRVVEPAAARRDELTRELAGIEVVAAATAEGGGSGDALLAVKPHLAASALAGLAAAGYRRVLSIAAGVPLAALGEAAGPDTRVLRSMPNTPATVGAGASALVTDGTDDADLAWAEEILGAVGTVVRVPEASIDAVTGLSGSGPAYVFLVAEALIEAGVLCGLPRDTARALTVQTIMGSGRLLAESGQDAAVLRANVTSPGGTTAAGLAALEDRATRAAFGHAVRAATVRSAELGRDG